MTTITILSHHASSLLNFRGVWIQELTNAGYRVLCLAPDYQDADRAAVRTLGAEPVDYSLQRSGMNPFRDLRDMLALIRVLIRLKPSVLFVFSIKPVIYGTLAAWLARVPRRVAMVEGAGYFFTESGKQLSGCRRLLRRVIRGLYRVALARAHCVIFLNPDDQREFAEQGLVQTERTRLLGGIGVDLDEWSLAESVQSPITFLLVARLLREKGIIEFASAARLVKQQHPEARFVLLGGLDTNPGGLGQAEVRSWVDEGLLEWPGHTTVQPWMKQASVFVLPSYYREGVPRSTQEAMALGRAVITTDAPGCRETVVDGVNGYLIPVRDVDALVQAMLSFIRNPDQIVSMGAASRAMAESRFDVRRVNARLTQWLLEAPARP